jgi:hypothetical protein
MACSKQEAAARRSPGTNSQKSRTDGTSSNQFVINTSHDEESLTRKFQGSAHHEE